ncbi:PREDICTED: uncharacterized protein LOC106104455 isoform X2 [Papilio polytes]|uniref:uncharacterized protein LOC106104455 isoform X2 n=1 Tax=Papilio polytes TaxID=76194 RepID=UPI0006762050|nr:PREDICTED: uncharacterized protein LOC106104455 isoform X2 [Papilio polytes]
MLKRTFHDLIEIKKKVAKLEKSKSAKTSKKRRRIITMSSSSDEEPAGSRPKGVKRSKEPPMPMAATSSTQEPEKAKPPAESSSRRKSSEAKGSRDGNKEPKNLTGIQIQDKFWRNVTRNLTIATADLLLYIKQYLFIFYGSNSQLDRHLYITRKILE